MITEDDGEQIWDNAGQGLHPHFRLCIHIASTCSAPPALPL